MKSELVIEAKRVELELDFSRRYWLCFSVQCIIVENYDDRPIADLGTVTEVHIAITTELYEYLLGKVVVVESETIGTEEQHLVTGEQLQKAFKSLTSTTSKIDNLLG